MTRHIVRDQRGGDVVLLQLPNGQPRTLQEGTGLVGEDIHLLARLYRRPDHTQRGAVASRRQRTGIAMREHRLMIGNQVRAVPPDGLVDGNVLEADLLRLGSQAFPDFPQWPAAQRLIKLAHAVNRPKKIDCRRTGAGQRIADPLHLRIQIASIGMRQAQRHPHRSRYPDGRRTANHHVADGGGDIFISSAGDILFVQRQARLVDHHHARWSPFNCFNHFPPTYMMGLK